MPYDRDAIIQLETLQQLSRAELRALWTKELAEEPPSSLGRDILALGIAYARQERLYGGLSRRVYRRKSSEHGLEQDFNSLDAQREAAEAYIKSQAHEGWRLLKARYDDGGLSGGTLERPALQSLLGDIEARLPPDQRMAS